MLPLLRQPQFGGLRAPNMRTLDHLLFLYPRDVSRTGFLLEFDDFVLQIPRSLFHLFLRNSLPFRATQLVLEFENFVSVLIAAISSR